MSKTMVVRKSANDNKIFFNLMKPKFNISYFKLYLTFKTKTVYISIYNTFLFIKGPTNLEINKN